MPSSFNNIYRVHLFVASFVIYANVAELINKVPATHLHDTGSKSHVSTSQARVSSRVLFMEK